MLIGESGDAQSVCFRTMDDTRPIDRHRDISLSDLFEWRTQTPMLCADLNVSLNFLAQPAVIDCNDIPPLQVCRDLVHPIKGNVVKSAAVPRQLRSSRSLENRALDEDKVVAVETYKFFPSTAHQTRGHRVQQFVGKMDTCGWLDGYAPCQFAGQRLQT